MTATPVIPAIPTKFKGVQYRSRLEARWAAFFDSLCWDFEYEPTETNGYVPDFLIHGPNSFLVEIKPARTWAEYWGPIEKIERGLKDTRWQDSEVLILGEHPVISYDEFRAAPKKWGVGEVHGVRPFGLIREYWGDDDGAEWSPGTWMKCRGCYLTVATSIEGSFAGRPCGHHEGDHLCGRVTWGGIKSVWDTAGNLTQWKGPFR